VAVRVLVVAGGEGAEFPFRQSVEGGELVVVDDEDLDVLGLFQYLPGFLGNGSEFEAAEVELDGFLCSAILADAFIELLYQLLVSTHLI
jgi:hypothetical protein